MNATRKRQILAARNLPTALLAAAILQLGGCAGYPTTGALRAEASRSPEAEAKLGIQIKGLHLSAHGYVLDLRYRVVDKDLAGPLLDRKKAVRLVDDAHGALLGVPESPVIGTMRQTSRNYVVHTDRDYFILFVNPGRAVRTGDVLKLAVDNKTIAQVTVE